MSRYQDPRASLHHQSDPNVVELENQFVLRLPHEPAQALKEALRIGAGNIRERLSIQLEPEKGPNHQQLRKGHVKFDGWNMSAKLMDLPTIIESMKTIDKKTFYKTADICQILICKEGDQEEEEPEQEEDQQEESESGKNKKKDANNKVDKKFLYMHGLCRPLKNCRKRRFRKTLRKKCAELPEIEKEVKNLLRADSHAIEVKYELITEDELNATRAEKGSAGAGEESNTVNQQDLFGAWSSDEDNEERQEIDIDSEGDTNTFEPNSAATSNMTSNLIPAGPSSMGKQVTEFSKEMFQSRAAEETPAQPSLEDIVAAKLESLKTETAELRTKKQELEKNIANCNNMSLLKQFKETLVDVETELIQREAEMEDLSMF